MDKNLASSEIDFYAQFSGEEEEFYALTLLGENDRIVWSTQSHWVGFTDESPKRELREASKVFARLAKVGNDIGQPFMVVRTPEQMLKFMMFGGHALITPTIFEEGFQEFLGPRVAIPDGYLGFSGKSVLDNTAFRRTPTPKLRMKILNRDQRRCRICGRNPDNHLDLELHVHHIRPWAHGGVTNDNNLVTLCNTCHSGLNPHFDPSLFEYTSSAGARFNITQLREKHSSGVREYRRIVANNEIGVTDA